MGTDYDCGCRESMGHVFLCDKHRRLMEGVWEKEKMDKRERELRKYPDFIIHAQEKCTREGRMKDYRAIQQAVLEDAKEGRLPKSWREYLGR